MGAMEKEMSEIKKLIKLVLQDKFRGDKVHEVIGLLSQEEKRAKLFLQAKIASNMSRSLRSELIRSNFIGDGVAIENGDDNPELEKVMCLIENNKIICRGDCLDISGKSENYDQCKECGNAAISKDLLLP